MVNFPLRKIFRGNLNEAISLAEISSITFARKVFLNPLSANSENSENDELFECV